MLFRSGYLATQPRLLARVAFHFANRVWRERRDFIAARGKIGKISFFVHNFMDSSQLDRERCDACSFMVMTPDGPLSMCVHNAKRDAYLLVAAKVQKDNKIRYFNPVTGQFEANMPSRITVNLTRKTARGRAKQYLEANATE